MSAAGISGRPRLISAVAGIRPLTPDPASELMMAEELRTQQSREELLALFARFSQGAGWFDGMMRRICLRALVQRCGVGLQVGQGVCLTHPETFVIGNGVFIGHQAILQGRYDGTFVVGDRVWIGPQCFLDARDLALGDHVGLGPGVKILGSEHTGKPANIPLVATDLLIEPVRVGDGADVGMGAVVMPGVTIGANAIVGAGAVVSRDVPEMATVAGVPARVIGWRDGREPELASNRSVD